jgi:hypothetical protein
MSHIRNRAGGRRAIFRVSTQLDGTGRVVEGKVILHWIGPNVMFTVKRKGSPVEYTLPLTTVATEVCQRVLRLKVDARQRSGVRDGVGSGIRKGPSSFIDYRSRPR